ncbi:MAG: alpha/beta fold hydrolase [Gammaproteobacteria bacterium]|nr:alpha/beta fold hydrolase [Gammaproteobacteria bacterium]
MHQNIENPRFPESEKYLFLPGEAGKIELLISPKPSSDSSNNSNTNKNICAIICHPHPLFSGTMDNKVVYTTHKALYYFGCHTIRFNFRGVGRSEGQHDSGVGETRDLLQIISWLGTEKPGYQIILAGFSFGAYIALKAAQALETAPNGQEILCLISIAPAVHHQDYKLYLPVNCPWLIIQGCEDEIVPAELVFDLVSQAETKSMLASITLIKFPETSHFFHGKLPDLKNCLIKYLNEKF